MKLIKSFVMALVLLIAIKNKASAQNTISNQPTDSLKTLNINVKGITCSTDLKMIAANVEKLNGVNSCNAGKQGTTTAFKVVFNPAVVTEKDIFNTIENTGSCENPDERPYKIKR